MKTQEKKEMKTQLQKDIENAAKMKMSYGHYKAYQRELEEKKKKKAKERRKQKGKVTKMIFEIDMKK